MTLGYFTTLSVGYDAVKLRLIGDQGPEPRLQLHCSH
jgi:hypothetical protein